MEFVLNYWHWIGLAVILGIVELVTFTFVVLGIAVGALTVGILLFFFPEMPFSIQLAIWSIDSLVFIGVWFKFVKNRSVPLDSTKLRKLAIGENGYIVRTPVEGRCGVVRFNIALMRRHEWTFRWEDDTVTTEVGERVSVVEVEGEVLIVKPS